MMHREEYNLASDFGRACVQRGAADVFLFGSVASRSAGWASDVDVAVRCNDAQGAARLAGWLGGSDWPVGRVSLNTYGGPSKFWKAGRLDVTVLGGDEAFREFRRNAASRGARLVRL